MHDELINAISNRQLIEFEYDGYHRVVVCTAIGRHKTTGNEVVRGYQVGGFSKTRPIPYWHLFKVDKISKCKTLNESFEHNPPGYKKGDSNIWPIEREL